MRATLFNRSRGVALAATIAQPDVWSRVDAQQAQRCVVIVTEVDAPLERDQVVSGVTNSGAFCDAPLVPKKSTAGQPWTPMPPTGLVSMRPKATQFESLNTQAF